jgi:NAD(P)-dependent dehydrogenase (short-subunit alcohol dehydrogenase family)
MQVAILDWSDSGHRAAASVSPQGGRVMLYQADVANSAEVSAAFYEVRNKFGPVEILVNCAAVQVLAPLLETTEAEWDKQYRVHLKGPFLCTRAAAGQMKAAGLGSIVNITSILGFVGDPALASYGAMKGFMIALTKSMAIALGPYNIRVNCVCPRDVNTPMARAYFDSAKDPARFALKCTPNMCCVESRSHTRSRSCLLSRLNCFRFHDWQHRGG